MVSILKIQIINQLPSDTTERVNNGVNDACNLFSQKHYISKCPLVYECNPALKRVLLRCYLRHHACLIK